MNEQFLDLSLKNLYHLSKKCNSPLNYYNIMFDEVYKKIDGVRVCQEYRLVKIDFCMSYIMLQNIKRGWEFLYYNGNEKSEFFGALSNQSIEWDQEGNNIINLIHFRDRVRKIGGFCEFRDNHKEDHDKNIQNISILAFLTENKLLSL